MRPIKFRAWSKSRKMLCYFGLLNETNEETISKDFGGKRDLDVMQFTGLLDKNGKEIYEGDIVSSIAEKVHRDQNGDNVVYAKINEGKWGLGDTKSFINDGRSWHNGLDFDWGGWEEHEVIGNIYENPELLNSNQS